MIINPTPANVFIPPTPVPRGQGIHVSGLIRSIAAHMGVLKPEWVDDPDYIGDSREITDETAILRILIGLAWEELYISKILCADGVVKHPKEYVLDHIHMSPDGISGKVVHGVTTMWGPNRTVGSLLVHEVKATYKSIKTTADFSKQWMWLTQGMAYCKGVGTREIRFHVLHLCGDYKMPIKPVAKCWDIEFTQKEIDDNWALMRDYRDYQEAR